MILAESELEMVSRLELELDEGVDIVGIGFKMKASMILLGKDEVRD
jgi:hypothetical protein